jgi:ABC-type spermidine/putrescine transport system permease subunit I
MDLPRGLRKPHHFAELILPLLAFVAVAGFTFSFFLYMGRSAEIPSGVAAPTARTPGQLIQSAFPSELLWGVGIAVLLLALIWGAWRYHSRNRANDSITEEATRLAYAENREQYDADRRDLQSRLRPS